MIKYNTPYKYLQGDPEIPNLNKEELTLDLDNLDNKELDLIYYPEDPDYN